MQIYGMKPRVFVGETVFERGVEAPILSAKITSEVKIKNRRFKNIYK